MAMVLGTYVAAIKRQIFEDLLAGREPSEGDFDSAILESVKDLGQPQVGTTSYAPTHFNQEFIYRGGDMNVVFSVKVGVPERIVFMPVPIWVMQTVWQGEVDGSFRFESEAAQLTQEFSAELEIGMNGKWFEKRLPTTRE